VAHKTAYNALVKAGCKIEYETFHYGVFEAVVPPEDTLRVAWSLGTSPMFRYVEPDIVEKENFN